MLSDVAGCSDSALAELHHGHFTSVQRFKQQCSLMHNRFVRRVHSDITELN